MHAAQTPQGRPVRAYRTADVEVPGGRLRVGIWEPAAHGGVGADAADRGVGADGADAAGSTPVDPAGKVPTAAPPTALCVHGITSSHLAWTVVADQLPDWRIVAPDLRGRGRSSSLPGPYGLARHADDVRAVAEALIDPGATGPLSSTVLVGHSMGGFVAVALLGAVADRSPGPADQGGPGGLVLVDGGIPLPIPPGTTAGADAIRATLGPTADRLRRTFADPAAYRRFWAGHPAFAQPWPDGVAEYLDYDLRPVDPQDLAAGLRPATDEAAMLADGVEIATPGGSAALRAGLAALSARWGSGNSGGDDSGEDDGTGVVLLRAPRDLVDREGGMYPADWAAEQVGRIPGLSLRDVPDTNHYSLLLTPAGAAAVARAIRAAAPRPA